MMLAIDICLMLICFLFEKFYLHYAQCDFDSILLHCIKLFIRQSIDREQIFDVTFENLPPLKNSAYAPGGDARKDTAVNQWRIQKILVGGDFKHKTLSLKF